MGHNPGTARAQPCPVACCCILLGVVAESFKPVKPLSQQLPTFLLFRGRQSVAQCSCITHDYLGDCQQSNNFVWWTTHDGPTLLGVVASICTSLPTWTQQHPTLLAQQCWELLCLFAHSLRFTSFSFKSDQRIYLICLYCTKQNTIIIIAFCKAKHYDFLVPVSSPGTFH